MAVEPPTAAGIELSVCGEMAGDPAAALALVGLGVRSLSMSAPSLAAVRRAIRGASTPALETAARTALDDRRPPPSGRVSSPPAGLKRPPAGRG